MLHYCQWQGRLLVLDSEKDTLTQLILKHNEDADKKWNLHPDGAVQNLPAQKFHTHLVFKVALDCRSGLQVPFILATHVSASECNQTYELLSCEDPLKAPGLQFDVVKSKLLVLKDVDSITNCDTYLLLDGPTIIWSEGAFIHIVHAAEMIQTAVDASQFVTGFHVTRITKLWSFEWDPSVGRRSSETCSNSMLLLLQLELEEEYSDSNSTPSLIGDEDKSSRVEWMCLHTKLISNSKELKVKYISDDLLVPFDYGCIATCITVHRSVTVEASTGDVISKCWFIVGTEYNQAVVFEDGNLLHCIPLEFTPKNIISMKTSAGEDTITIQGTNSAVNAFEVSEKGFHECGNWQNVSEMFVGDFAHLGHDQLLLIFKSQSYSFCVTDLKQFKASDAETATEEEDMETGQPCAESLQGAIQALQLRKQSSAARLIALETELQQKSELLRSSLEFMTSLGRDGESESCERHCRRDPGLICLIPGDFNDDASVYADTLGEGRESTNPPLKVINLWQRLSEGRWIVGILAKNQSKSAMHDTCFSLVMSKQYQPSKCTSKIVWKETTADSTSLTTSSKSTTNVSDSDEMQLAKRRKLDPKVEATSKCTTSDHSFSTVIDEPPHTCASLQLQPGKCICVVVSTPLTVVDTTALQSAVVVGSWKDKHEGEKVDVHRVDKIARIGISAKLVCSGELNLSKQCISGWTGDHCIPSTIEELGQTEVQDLTCLIAIRSLIKIEATATYTNLLRLPGMLRTRLPLPSQSILTSGCAQEEAAITPNYSQEGRAYTVGNTTQCDILDGIAIHVRPTVTSAIISVLYKSSPQLSFLLSVLRKYLPEDISLSFMDKTRANYRQTFLKSLNSIRKEVRAKTKALNCRLQEEGQDDSSVEVAQMQQQTDSAIIELMNPL